MTPPAGGTERRDRRRRVARNVIALGLAVHAFPGVAHAFQSNQPSESPSIPTAGQIDRFPMEQKAKRPHGGPRIPGPAIVGSRQPTPVENRTAQSTRGSIRGSGVHRLYTSGNAQTENTSSYSPFTDNVTRAQQGAILGLGKPLDRREHEGFNPALIVEIVKKASPADLENLAALNIDKIKNPAISGLLKNALIAEDQLIAFQLLADEISTLIESYQGKFNKSFEQDLSNTVNSFIEDYGQYILLGLNASMFVGLFGAVLTNVSAADIRKRGRSLAAGVLLLTTACTTAIGPLITPIASAAPSSTPNPTPTQPTGIAPILIENQATLVAPPGQNMESPYADLNFGVVAGKPFGSIAALKVNTNNPNYILPDNQTESKHNFYYRSGDLTTLRGLGLDQKYLIDVFNAADTKGGITGKLPDGTEVKFINGFWQYNKDGQTYYLLSNVANLEKRLLGYPLLVVDKTTGKQLFFGIVDDNGVLLKGSKFDPAFLSTANLAKNLGYTGDPNLIGSFRYDQYGNILIIDIQGNKLSVLPYLNPFARPPEPTLIPTPSVRMIEVNGLKIPDPKASNPELFDLKNPNSPIVQFANAFGVKPEDVGNLTPKLLIGVDGKQFIVLTTGDLIATANFNESGIPLFIAEQKDGVWGWRRIGLKDLELRLNLEAGDSLVYITADHGKGYGDYVLSDEYHRMLANNYSIITLAQGTYWKWFERTKDGPIDSWSEGDILAQIKIIQKMKQINPNLKIRIAPFGSFPEGNPDWLNGLSQDEAKIQIREHMQRLFNLLTQNGITPDEYVVVNEPFFRGSNWVRQDALYNSLGYDYITYAFTTAREIVGNKPLLIYNDTANNSRNQNPYSYYTNLTKQQATALKQAGITNFAVGMQMHLYGNAPVNEEDLIKTMQDYGVPVYITELDVDVSMLSPQARNKALSDIYTSVFRAAIKSGVVKGISTWNGVDDLSNPVDYLRKSGASPTLFSGSVNPQPKEVYYKVLKELLSNFHN